MSKPFEIAENAVIVICEDMFPMIEWKSEDFRVIYFIVDRDTVDNSMRDIPYNFFDSFYINPLLSHCEGIEHLFAMLKFIMKIDWNSYTKSILSDLLHSFIIVYHLEWEKENGIVQPAQSKSQVERICNRFYNLVSDHFTEHRDTAYYAQQLCISPGYLATVMKQICGETPKMAIDRMVTMEMKYILRNTPMSVKEMAEHLHFPDTSYMCRFFKRSTGYSFSEYRAALTSE